MSASWRPCMNGDTGTPKSGRTSGNLCSDFRRATFGKTAPSEKMKTDGGMMVMRIQWRRALAFALVMMLAVGPSAAAFDDVPADGSGSVILELREKGIVLGDGKSFAGERALTLAEGLAMIVRGFELQAGPDEPADLSAGDPADPEAEGA